MVTGQEFSWDKMQDFLLKTFLYIALDSLTRFIKNRVAIENKMVVKKLILERVLYSELGAIEKLNTGNLEQKITADITQTLNFVNRYLPSLVSGLYAFLIESAMLYRKRRTIDILAVVYPVLIALIKRLLEWAQYKYFTKKQKKKSKMNIDMLDACMANALEGLTDIQVNNLQAAQLANFDKIAQKEIKNKEGFASLFAKAFATVNSMSVFAYAIEVWFVHKIMKRQNFDHKQFSKIQQEIDHVVTLGRNTFNLMRRTKYIFKYQSKVVKLLDTPNFIDEHERLPPIELKEFKELRIRDIRFSYSPELPPALDLTGQEILFLPGKKYALIGQNKAGKSTLTKIICKLYTPNEGYIALNGIPYERIPRVYLRNLISYIPQRPFIFPGTIRENILVGNPDATEEEVLAAAEAAGVFAFLANDLMSPRTPLRSESLRHTTSLGATSLPHSASSQQSVGPLRSILQQGYRELTHLDWARSDSSNNMIRTVSFNELGSIVAPHPHNDFYSNTQFGMYPLNLPENIRGIHSNSRLIRPQSSDRNSATLSASDTKTPHHTLTYDSDDSDEFYGESGGSDDEDMAVTTDGDDVDDDDGHNSSDSEGKHSLAPGGEFDEHGAKLNAILLKEYKSHKGEKSDDDEDEKDTKAKKKKMSMSHSASLFNLTALAEKSKQEEGVTNRHPILDQPVSVGGKDVSGAFAQAISLARVFVRTSAKIVILDESMCQLDQVKVRSIVLPKLYQFVKKWNMCLIIITHNMTGIYGLDHIYVLHEGRIVHEGTHQQLVEAKASLYLQLLGHDLNELELDSHTSSSSSPLVTGDNKSNENNGATTSSSTRCTHSPKCIQRTEDTQHQRKLNVTPAISSVPQSCDLSENSHP